MHIYILGTDERSTTAFHSSAREVHMTQKSDSHLICGACSQIRLCRTRMILGGGSTHENLIKKNCIIQDIF